MDKNLFIGVCVAISMLMFGITIIKNDVFYATGSILSMQIAIDTRNNMRDILTMQIAIDTRNNMREQEE